MSLPSALAGAVLILMAAFFVGFLGSRRAPVSLVPGRYDAIDGLRGLLALFVVMHHSCLWYMYIKTGHWGFPGVPKLFVYLGPASVSVFFMITALLFTGKLLAANDDTPVDWARLYIGRVLRVVPLYYMVCMVMFVVVFAIMGVHTHIALRSQLSSLLRWMFFLGDPDINGFVHTSLIVAGVTWSLTYEWIFYFSLPLVAVALRKKVPTVIIAPAVGAIVLIKLLFRVRIMQVAAFSGGFLAIYCTKNPRIVRILRSNVSSVAMLVFIVAWILKAPMPVSRYFALLLSLPFACVACGNSLWGILTHRAVRWLGDVSYGIYLIHGICLYLLWTRVVGLKAAAELSQSVFWLIVTGAVMGIVALAGVSHKYLEMPALARTRSIQAKLGM